MAKAQKEVGVLYFSVPSSICSPSNLLGMGVMPGIGGISGPNLSYSNLPFLGPSLPSFQTNSPLSKGAMESPVPYSHGCPCMHNFQQGQSNGNRSHIFKLEPIMSGKLKDTLLYFWRRQDESKESELGRSLRLSFLEWHLFWDGSFPLRLYFVITHINTAPNASTTHLIEKLQLFSLHL